MEKSININIYYNICSETGNKILDSEMMLNEYFDKVNELINKI